MGQRIGTIKSNDVQAVVWKNGDYYSFQLQKVYYNRRDDEWKKSETIFANDLEDVIICCTKAKNWLKAKGIVSKTLPKETERASTTVDSVLKSLGVTK